MDKRYAFEEVTFVHFLEFFSGFAYDINMRFRPGRRGGTDLLRRPPGGKTCRVRKPPVFIRFDVPPQGAFPCPFGSIHLVAVKAGINLRGRGPLTTPRIAKRSGIHRSFYAVVCYLIASTSTYPTVLEMSLLCT